MSKIIRLEETVRDFLEESISLLQIKNVKGQFKSYYEPCFKRSKDGGRRITVRKKKRYSFDLIRYEKEILSLQSCKVLEEQIGLLSNSIEGTRNTKSTNLEQYIYKKSYPVEILYTDLDKQRKIPQLSPINFQNTIKGLSEILIEKEVGVINIALLSRDLVFWRSKKLDDNTTFKFLTLKELSDLFNEASLATNFSGVRSWLDNWAIVVYEKVPLHDFLNCSYDSTRRLREIILAMRLCEEAYLLDRLSLSRFRYKTGLLKGFEGYRYTRSLRNICLEISTPPQTNLPPLKKIRNSMLLVSKSKGLDDPLLQKFLYAPERRRIEDALLDLIIVLEGIIVPDRGDSIRYRFSMRATGICNKHSIQISTAAQIGYLSWFKDLYDQRSNLVHGNVGTNKDLDKFLKKYGYSSVSILFDELYRVSRRIVIVYLEEYWYKLKRENRAKKGDEIILSYMKRINEMKKI